MTKRKAETETDRLKSHTLFICRKPRHVGTDHLETVANFIALQWADMGGTVTRSPYEAKDHRQTWPVENLFLRLGDPAKPRIVVGAHYDGVEGTTGADDNASAVAVLLELSRRFMAEGTPKNTCIEFAAWTCEEPPFFAGKDMGSQHHVLDLKKERVSVRGMVCLEMVGYFSDRPGSQSYPPGFEILQSQFGDVGNFYAVTGKERHRAWVQGVRRELAVAMKTPLVEITLPHDGGDLDLSDHRNFEAVGIPSVMVGDTAYFRNPHYHRESDTPDTLDYKAMSDLVGGLNRWCRAQDQEA